MKVDSDDTHRFAPLALVSSYEDLQKALVGRALAGQSFVTWCYAPRLAGTVHFGHRDVSDAALLIRLYSLISHKDLRLPIRRVVDGRDFVGVGEDAWRLMTDRLAPVLPRRSGLIERQALILRPGAEGVRVASLLPTLGPGDPFKVFEDPAEAFEWADPDDGPAAFRAVEELIAGLQGPKHFASKARAWIEANLCRADVDRCALELGLSRRSLQRHLSAASTSFRELSMQARVETAKRLLSDPRLKVATVAREVGCSSVSQLGVLLKRAGLPLPSRQRS